MDEAVALLRAAADVTLLAHVNPDADALGSALALGLGLHRRGARVRVSFGAPEQPPESLRGLDAAGLLVPAGEVPPCPELLVVLDTASPQRLGPLVDRVATAGAVLVVDHHGANTRFGTHRLVDPGAEATVVLVLRLLDALDVSVDEPIARCIYAGLVTDTRNFRGVGPATHLLAARLLASGVDAAGLTRRLLDTHPFGWLGMLSVVLGRARLEPHAARGMGLVHTEVRLADSVGLGPEEVESVIDIVRTCGEAEVAAVFKEVETDTWSVSLRSTSRVDVGAVADALGGGGHRHAAGFSSPGPAARILRALRAALADVPPL